MPAAKIDVNMAGILHSLSIRSKAAAYVMKHASHMPQHSPVGRPIVLPPQIGLGIFIISSPQAGRFLMPFVRIT